MLKCNEKMVRKFSYFEAGKDIFDDGGGGTNNIYGN